MNKKIIITFVLSFIVCLNSQGQVIQQWVQNYNGTGNGTDQPSSVAVDDAGFIYVSGNSAGLGTSADLVTIKYDPNSGDALWLSRYSGPLSDQVNALACGSNAVYVTGWSIDPGRDIITIKYNASTGQQEWVKKYNGPGNGGDYGFAIALDAAGNAYVCGRVADIGNVQHFVVLKYSSASGDLASGFPVIYRGAFATAADESHSIAVDNTGNIYVTGKTLFNAGTGDILTLKLNTSGALMWDKKFSGYSEDNGVVVKLSSQQTNVFVGGWGFRTGFQDFLILKYGAANGDSLAFASYNGPTNSTDILTSMAVDINNNVTVTGNSLNNSLNKYETATIRFNSDLILQWAARHASAGWDLSSSVTADVLGNVYICGRTVGSSLNDDFLTVMYGSTGAERWVQKYNGSGNGADAAACVALDGFGNIIVTGWSTVSGPFDFTTIKYMSSFNALENISLLLYKVGLLETSGVLTENQARVLTIQLEKAESKILQGQFRNAAPHINVFILEVGILVRRGILTDFQSDQLIETAYVILTQLEEMDNGPLTLNSIPGLPAEYELHNNFPNPFNPTTRISFDIPVKSETEIIIYDITGKEIDILLQRVTDPGRYEAEWNAANYSSGVYFYRIVSGSFSETKRMILIK